MAPVTAEIKLCYTETKRHKQTKGTHSSVSISVFCTVYICFIEISRALYKNLQFIHSFSEMRLCFSIFAYVYHNEMLNFKRKRVISYEQNLF